MTTELLMLAWGCVLAFVHIFAAAQAKTKQYGLEWNMSARDGTRPPLSPVAGRLVRAQANFFETFPIAVAAILLVALTGRFSDWTRIGAILWLASRVVYLPLYGFGVPKLRSLVWGASVVGIVLMLKPLLL